LDPQVSGVLPLGLGEATKALGVLLYGPKEYHALGRLHSLPSKEKLSEIIQMFTGELFQKPLNVLLLLDKLELELSMN